MALMCLCDAERQRIDSVGDHESAQCRAERRMRAFTSLQNGGFRTAKAREFQNRWVGLTLS